jgi:CHASE2 domain-containing sensor protein
MATLNPAQRLARFFLLPLATLSDRLGNTFYGGLAVTIMAIAALTISTGLTSEMKSKAYDLIMKTRLNYPTADPDIVILDIDEAALAAMAKDFGRWPWPRSIMGEMVEGIRVQKPKAIVFDITFSDPDVFNAEGDKYFRNSIVQTPNTYFPMIRLNEGNDKLSQFQVKRIPGVTGDENADPNATYAVVLPYLYDVLDDHRLGTNNLYADADGIVRNYHVYRNEYGWWVNSLPANVAAATGATLPDDPDILLNWRGKPPSYRTVSFHDVYFDFLKEKKTRPADEFAGKIVIIGSTAPSLFDIKPTSMARIHPGVEILATALDNLKNRDYLTELPRWVAILVTMVSVSLLGLAFIYNIDQRAVNLTFTFAQTGFLAISYLFLNFSPVFVDLTAPFTFSLLYFTIARFNSSFQTQYRNGHPLFSTLLEEDNECRAVLIECHNHIAARQAQLRLRAALKRQVGLSRFGVISAPLFKPFPLLHAFFRDTLLFYWLVPKKIEAEALQDVVATLTRMAPVVDKAGGRPGPNEDRRATFLIHTCVLHVDVQDRWRLQGEEALARTMGMANTVPSAAQGGSIRIVATQEFDKFCRSTLSQEMPAALIQAGLPAAGRVAG